MPESRFPIDVASDLEFALIYGALLLVAVLVAKQLEQIVAGLAEPASRNATSAATRLVIGKLPLASDLDRVALVRGGVSALAELVRERAFAEGWLRQDEKGIAIGAAVPQEATLSTALRAALPFARATEADLERASRAVALAYRASSSAQLEAAGLLPGPTVRALERFAYALPAMAMLAIGFMRAARAAELGHGTGPAIAQLFICGAVFAGFATVPRRTQAAERYVGWLKQATEALREDMANGSLNRREDFLLLVAAYGAKALKADGGRTTDRLSMTSEHGEGGGGMG